MQNIDLRKDDTMNTVGIDISKGKSMIAIARPFGEIIAKPFEVIHSVASINSLVLKYSRDILLCLRLLD